MIPWCRFTFFIYVNGGLLSLSNIDENKESTFITLKNKNYFLPTLLWFEDLWKTILNKQWSRWLEKGFLLTALQEAVAIAQAMKRSHRFLLNGSCLASQSQTGQLGIRGSPWLQEQRHLPQLLGLTSSQGLLEQRLGQEGLALPAALTLGWANLLQSKCHCPQNMMKVTASWTMKCFLITKVCLLNNWAELFQ